MSDEIPESIRNMTKCDVLRAIASGVFIAKNIDGTEWKFPPGDCIDNLGKTLAKAKPNPLCPTKIIVRHNRGQSPARLRTYAAQNGHCYYCGHYKHFDLWTVDHKTPICRGGRNTMENIIGSCRVCNDLKGPLTLEEYLEIRHDNKLRKAKILDVQEELRLKTLIQ